MFQKVAGEVFADELIVRLVLVEGIDGVIAEAPGVGEDEGATSSA